MRLPNEAHESGPWRIRAIAPDFILEDAWALPVHGKAEDFQWLLDRTVSSDPSESKSVPTRVLWGVRDRLGSWFGLGRISDAPDGGDHARGLPIPGTSETSLSRPASRKTCATRRTDLTFRSLPFMPLYRTDTEFAAELSNRTVHGVMHLAWVAEGGGSYQGRMAVYVKPRGRLGQAYMTLIKPFRLWLVYPALMRQIENGIHAPARSGARSVIGRSTGACASFDRWTLNRFVPPEVPAGRPAVMPIMSPGRAISACTAARAQASISPRVSIGSSWRTGYTPHMSRQRRTTSRLGERARIGARGR